MSFHQYLDLVGLTLIGLAVLTLIALPVYGAHVTRKRLKR